MLQFKLERAVDTDQIPSTWDASEYIHGAGTPTWDDNELRATTADALVARYLDEAEQGVYFRGGEDALREALKDATEHAIEEAEDSLSTHIAAWITSTDPADCNLTLTEGHTCALVEVRIGSVDGTAILVDGGTDWAVSNDQWLSKELLDLTKVAGGLLPELEQAVVEADEEEGDFEKEEADDLIQQLVEMRRMFATF